VSPVILFSLVAVAIFVIALYSLLVSRHLLRKLLALNVMGSGVFLFFVAMARRAEPVPDPVPHAMVLTGIVVTVGATGLAVTLVRRRFAETGKAHLPEDSASGDA
jgi:multicomponent Na+:H+ antiporter subunit C